MDVKQWSILGVIYACVIIGLGLVLSQVFTYVSAITNLNVTEIAQPLGFTAVELSLSLIVFAFVINAIQWIIAGMAIFPRIGGEKETRIFASVAIVGFATSFLTGSLMFNIVSIGFALLLIYTGVWITISFAKLLKVYK